jgi:hypothetical protein
MEDASLLPAVIGATSVTTPWIGRRTSGALRDAGLMASVGACLLTAAAAAYFL